MGASLGDREDHGLDARREVGVRGRDVDAAEDAEVEQPILRASHGARCEQLAFAHRGETPDEGLARSGGALDQHLADTDEEAFDDAQTDLGPSPVLAEENLLIDRRV